MVSLVLADLQELLLQCVNETQLTVMPGEQETHTNWNKQAVIFTKNFFSHFSTYISMHVFSLHWIGNSVSEQVLIRYLVFLRSPCVDEPGRLRWTGTAWSCPPRSLCICSSSQTGSRARGNLTPTTAGSTSHYLRKENKRRRQGETTYSDLFFNWIRWKFICIALLTTDVATKMLYRNPGLDLDP